MTPPPDRTRLAVILDEIATLLELDGANQFRSGAYARAARAVKDVDADLGLLAREGRLTEIDGIGKGLATKIAEFCETGAIAERDELRARIPEGLVAMTAINGLGPKKARAIHAELGIDSIEALEAAARDGRLAALKGFGPKTAANILAGIELHRRHAGRFRIDVALAAAAPILEGLRRQPAVLRAELGGSARRHLETVKDLDFIVATEDAESVMDWFCSMPEAVRVLGRGDTKASVVLESTMQADLRCVAPSHFAWTLHHFTGSKEHNTAMRRLAKERGYRMNEYGLLPEDGGPALSASTEREVFAHLGLDEIPPELREDMGEIDAAAAHALPHLIARRDIRGVLHMHTEYSDGRPRCEEYALWAARNGISWMGIADHSQSAGYAGGLKPDRVHRQRAEIAEINARHASSGVTLLAGIESDILADGSLDYEEDELAQFDFVVASVHSNFNLPEDEQTARSIRAVRNPHTTVLGHPTGRLLLQREGLRIDIRAVIREAARQGTAIEINGNPHRLDLDWRLVRHALEQGCWISLGPDAHVLDGLADLDHAIAIGRKGWLTPGRVLNCLTLDEFREFVRARRTRGTVD